MLAASTFEGKTFFITGAGTGIGKSFASRAAALGATVVLGGRREALLREAADEIRLSGGKALVRPVDIREPEQVESVIDGIVAETGRRRILDSIPAGRFGGLEETVEPGQRYRKV